MGPTHLMSWSGSTRFVLCNKTVDLVKTVQGHLACHCHMRTVRPRDWDGYGQAHEQNPSLLTLNACLTRKQ